MPLNIGTSSTEDIYMGSSGVNRVYLGSDLVFGHNPRAALFTSNSSILIGTTTTTYNFDAASYTGYTVSSGQVVVDEEGWYLLSYTQWLGTFTGTNRSEVQCGVQINGTLNQWSRSSAYIRRNQTEQDIASATFPVYLSANDTIQLEAIRTDSNSATVGSLAGGVGCSIFKLPSDVTIFLASGGSTTSTGTTGLSQRADLRTDDIHTANGSQYTLSTNNTGQSSTISLNSGAMQVTDAGRYLVGYSAETQNTSTTARAALAGYVGVNNSPEYGQALGYAYNRGSNSTQNAIMSAAGFLDLAASDEVDLYFADCGEAAGGTNHSVLGGYAWMIKVPSVAVDLEFSGTASNVTGYGTSLNQMYSGTLSEDDDYLFVYNLEHNRTASLDARKSPAAQVNVNGVSTGGINSNYNRGTQSTTGVHWSATSGAYIKIGASRGDTASLEVRDIQVASGNNIQTVGATSYFAAIRMSRLGL